MARTRTTKKLAQRIDLNYFKRPTPLKRAKFWLSVSLPLLAFFWIAWRGFSGDHRVYSSGRLSRAHAVLEKECSACHVQQAGAFSAKAADSACLDCHDGPVHHTWLNLSPPNCAFCHAEHRSRANLSAVRDENCEVCHQRLQPLPGVQITDFEDGHPEFAALRPVAGTPPSDPARVKLNHAIHMKAIRRGPNGALVNLECGNCHRPMAANPDLTYSDAKYSAAIVSYKDSDEFLPMRGEGLRGPKPITDHELMAPVRFANACAACHSLTFDRRFDEGVPHDKPEVVHAFLVREFQQYIASHPSELRATRDADQELTGRPFPPQIRTLAPQQWIAERTAEAEELLWRKTCNQCHTLGWLSKNLPTIIPQRASRTDSTAQLSASGTLPYIEQANVTLQWMPHAKFDHDAHRGFTCLSCHAKALTSTEASDILLPGIATCRTCHAPGPGHAESRCSECHTYHDWSKRKEVTPKFTLPALQTGR